MDSSLIPSFFFLLKNLKVTDLNALSMDIFTLKKNWTKTKQFCLFLILLQITIRGSTWGQQRSWLLHGQTLSLQHAIPTK